jgi:hypothetical protein
MNDNNSQRACVECVRHERTLLYGSCIIGEVVEYYSNISYKLSMCKMNAK